MYHIYVDPDPNSQPTERTENTESLILLNNNSNEFSLKSHLQRES